MRKFHLILIKPSHYDDDGYVIRWWRAMIPSNSLAAVYGIATDCVERRVLGPDVEIEIDVIDETHTRVDVPALLARLARDGNFGLVGLVGVQSNQYPRALDIARPFRAAGVAVAMGGFHVSGCLSMLDGQAVELDACRELGIAMFAGEAEGRFDAVLRDAAAGTLKPLYNYMNQLPGMEDTPVPYLPRRYVERTIGHNSSFDAGRGCPYQCSFCTIINVQGRKSRYRSADDVERLVRMNWAQGIDKFFITDDNFARNKEWELIFDRLIELREQGIPLGLMIQVDTLCHKIPNFVEKAHRAGVTRVFIGLENINPDNLVAAKKKQNKITEYRKMLLAWKSQGIITLAGYILGFPADTPESIKRDLAIIQRELPLDILEFFCLTPLPGSEDHQKLWKAGVAMDGDLNKYDLEHACTGSAQMTAAQLQQAYLDAWPQYYSPEHMKTLLRRAVATGMPREQRAQAPGALRHDRVGGRNSPAAERPVPRQASERAPPRSAAREPARVLATLCVRDGVEDGGDAHHDRPDDDVEVGDRAGAERTAIHGSGAHAGARRRRADARAAHQDHRRQSRGRPPQEGPRHHPRQAGRGVALLQSGKNAKDH